MPSNPLVSIIVRTKDRPKLLKKALRSIASQDYRPVEAVLVNDGGYDLDIAALKDLLGDVSLNYVRLEKNMGRAHAGNVGIENAKGEYIGFLDDDDEIHPDHLVTLVSFLEKSDYKVAYTDSFMVFKEYDPLTCDLNKETKREVIFSQDFDFDRLIFENYIPFMCLLFGRQPLIASGGIDTSLELYEDWDLLIRIGKKYPFYHIKEVTADYNQWSVDLQISQANKDHFFVRDAYLKVLSRHIREITPKRIHSMVAEYAHGKQILREIQNRFRLNENLLSERDIRIIGLHNDLSGKNIQITNLHKELNGRDARIDGLNSELIERESRIGGLNNELAERDGRINNLSRELSERDIRIDGLTKELNERDARIDGLNSELIERESRIGGLNNELTERDNRIGSLSNELDERDIRINGLTSELNNRDTRINGLNSELVEREDRISGLDNELTERDNRIGSLSNELKERDIRIGELTNELGERDARINGLSINLKEKNVQMNNLLSELSERKFQMDGLVAELGKVDSQLNSLTNVVHEKEKEISILQSAVRDREALVTAMKNTRGWRILEGYRKIRDGILRVI